MRSAWLALLSVLAAGPAVAVEPDAPAQAETPPPETLRIGVAPFEGVAGPEALLPDLASFLSKRLERVDGVEIVDPTRLGAPAVLEPDAEAVRRWADRADLDAVVLGRTTRASEAVSLDLRLRSGVSGELVESWFREMKGLDEAAATIDRLVPELVADVAMLRDAPAEERPSGANFGLSVDSAEPLSIRSDELEAVQSQGARRLVFRQNVVASQADVRITAERLEAFYPAGASKPDRLFASGDVVMAQGGREAHCDEAIYERVERRLICRGNAELQDGEDRVAGREIVFDLETEAVTVSGSAAVVFHPGGGSDAVPN